MSILFSNVTAVLMDDARTVLNNAYVAVEGTKILSVGTELLMGQIANTDAQYISRRLSELGVTIYRHTTVGDNPARVKEALGEAVKEVRISSILKSAACCLSADGPIRPPYAVYFQGGLTWHHAKLGILLSLQKMVDAGLVSL